MNLWKGARIREYTLETDFETLTLWNPCQTREPRAPPLSTVSKKGCTRAMSLLTLYHPMGCSPPGSSVHGILQATILGWIAVPSCRGSSRTRDQTCVSYVFCIGRQVLYS